MDELCWGGDGDGGGGGVGGGTTATVLFISLLYLMSGCSFSIVFYYSTVTRGKIVFDVAVWPVSIDGDDRCWTKFLNNSR